MALFISQGKNRTTPPARALTKVTNGCSKHDHWDFDCPPCIRQARFEAVTIRNREVISICDLMGQRKGNRP